MSDHTRRPGDCRPDPDPEGHEDPALRARFAALRAEDAARTPAFERFLRRAGSREFRPRARLAPAAGLAVALLAVIGVAVLRRSPEPLAHTPAASPTGAMSPAAPALADWRAPTDFLLDTPGRALLDTVPRIGPAASSGPGQRRRDDPLPLRPMREEHPS